MKILCVDDGNTEVDVPGDTLVGADLTDINLHRALLQDADLRQVRAEHVNWRGSFLEWADARGADFGNAKLMDVTLFRTHCRETNFAGANLSGVIANEANFVRADFTGADVSFASLINANFVDALCLFADTKHADFTGALFSAGTKFSENFNPVEHGMVLASDRPNLV